MPYLRFSRDKRGYEHTYVLHGHRVGARPRVLYWFRTPPSVKVGRLPLDEDAIRAIEASNPDLIFDWTKMLRVRPPPPPPDPDEARRGRSRRAGGRQTPAPRPERGQRAVPTEAAPATDTVPGEAAVEPASAADTLVGPGLEAEPATAEADVPALLDEGDEPDAGQDVEPAAEIDPDDPAWQHPVAALLGDTALARLRASYAELRARLGESRVDEAVLEEMTARVEALNPDGWRHGEQVVLGIERFESESHAIKAALGRRPPRTR